MCLLGLVRGAPHSLPITSPRVRQSLKYPILGAIKKAWNREATRKPERAAVIMMPLVNTSLVSPKRVPPPMSVARYVSTSAPVP